MWHASLLAGSSVTVRKHHLVIIEETFENHTGKTNEILETFLTRKTSNEKKNRTDTQHTLNIFFQHTFFLEPSVDASLTEVIRI